eukprot:m.249321 g.249321  ORF g.249321 m.249321 type:complete len:66 (+) comp15876_c1_seq1:360-557(+)
MCCGVSKYCHLEQPSCPLSAWPRLYGCQSALFIVLIGGWDVFLLRCRPSSLLLQVAAHADQCEAE